MALELAAETLRRAQIEEQQIEILFRHAYLVQAANLLVATGVVWFLWPFAEHGLLSGWWQCVAVIAGLRVLLALGYQHRSRRSSAPWHRIMTVMTLFSGAIWGTAGVLFFNPESGVSLVFITIVLAGMTAGSMASHFSWPQAQFAYAIPTMMPIALRYLLENGDLRALGLMCIFYLFVMLGFARYIFQTVVASIRLQIENRGLVQRLHEEMRVSEAARTEAEEANTAKSKFLAAASHDLRQPLHAVNLLIEVLRNERDRTKAAEVINHLGGAAQALEGLLNELLDISRLEAGMFQPERSVIDLQEVFNALQRELNPVAEEKGIELGFAATRLKIYSDPHMLGRILRNVVTNAIRYTEHGAVLVGCRRRGQDVSIAVYDTGPGIAPEHQQAIFREFHQLGNPERDRRKGLGLGLAIVDGLCRVLGHELELKSRVGYGTAFLVRVPIANHDDAPLPPRDTILPDVKSCAVLVIDDEPLICRATVEVLTGWGCRSLAVESAAEAIAGIGGGKFEPDVIITDYRLRDGCTGAEAIDEVRCALGREVPALILTGDTAPERLIEAQASGCLLLHKPMQPARLRAALASLF